MNTHWNVCGKCPLYFFKCDSQVGITLFFLNLPFSIILFADWKTFFMAGSLISHLGQLVALSSGGNSKKNLRSLTDHGGTAALCLFSLLGVFYVWESEMNFFLFELLLFYSFSYLFGTAFDRMRFHLNDAKRLGVMEDWWVIEMNTRNNLRNPEKLLIPTKK